jgi:hypothetical protein
MWCDGNYYKWKEIKRFSVSPRYPFAFLKFSDGKGKFIQVNTFRLKDKPIKRFWVRNETFDQFSCFIQEIISENELDPEYRRVRDHKKYLERQMEKSQSDDEKASLAKRWIKVNYDLMDLEAIERKKYKAKMNKMYRDIILAFILVVIIIAGAVTSSKLSL